MTTATPEKQTSAGPGLIDVDINEYGGKKEGERQKMNRRTFMQLVVFDAREGTGDGAAKALAGLVREQKIPSVIYADAVNPSGVGLLTWAEDPAHFVTKVRPLFGHDALGRVKLRKDFAMFGRTYSTGHEPDLEHALLRRPIENVLKETDPWHVWYPLRRTGAFAKLEPAEQGSILREHAHIGFSYGQQDLAHDVRLACHALDAEDNEFVIGLVGKDLHPLSHLVQTMRKTTQTSLYISKMGPFFVGYAAYRNA